MAQSNLVINRYSNISDKYEVGEQIGRGAYGDVMVAREVKLRKKRAIKVIKLDFLNEDESKKLIEEIKKEASLMSTMDHPNILKYIECFQYGDSICIVSEYCEETLTNVLRTHIKDNTRPSIKLVIEWLYKLSQGLEYLHDRSIIHRDIKTMNILFKNGEIKIADFGEARLKTQTTMTQRGTLVYMSPEMLRNEKFTESTDIWSMGCVFFEIYYLEQAFDGSDPYTTKKNICNRKIKHLNTDVSKISNLIDQMLDTDQKERITIKQVLSHDVFKEFKNVVQPKDEEDDNSDEEKIPELFELCSTPENNYKKIRKLITEEHVNVNYRGSEGETALIYASYNGHKDVVALLIQNGAVVNEKNNYGTTALIYASKKGQKEVVELLIKNKASVREKNAWGDTALLHASKNGHKEVVELLVKNGAVVNEKTDSRWTALTWASKNGHEEVVKYLTSKGAVDNF